MRPMTPDGHKLRFSLVQAAVATEVICPHPGTARPTESDAGRDPTMPCKLADGRCEVKEYHRGDPGMFIDCMIDVPDDYYHPLEGEVEIEWDSWSVAGEEPEWELEWRPVDFQTAKNLDGSGGKELM